MLMSAYGQPRACECAKANATLLCYFNYDEWHSEYWVLCPPCWRSRHGWNMIEEVEAVWNGTQWCLPAANHDWSNPQPGEPINPPQGLPGGRLIVANAPLPYRPAGPE
jgi:hypothetical protein